MGDDDIPAAHRVRKRSVRIAGHRTSVSLEDAFWNELALIAERRGQSINALIAAIDAGRGGNLSSALRVFILNEVREANGLNEVREANGLNEVREANGLNEVREKKV